MDGEEHKEQDIIDVHVYHHFPDPVVVVAAVTIEQVPASLGLIPGPSTPIEEEIDTNG